jgi:hypothetical protein
MIAGSGALGNRAKPQIYRCGFNFMPASSSSSLFGIFCGLREHLRIIDREGARDDPGAGR